METFTFVGKPMVVGVTKQPRRSKFFLVFNKDNENIRVVFSGTQRAHELLEKIEDKHEQIMVTGSNKSELTVRGRKHTIYYPSIINYGFNFQRKLTEAV